MPNWCSCFLTIKGENDVVQRFKDVAVGHCAWSEPAEDEKPNVLNFHSLVPVPADVLQASYNAKGYDWELANWGCKWGACSSELVDDNGSELFYNFDTAWAPPTEFLKHLGKLWPNLMFVLEYEEPGMAFKGLCKVHGELFEDHCIQI